MKKKLILVVAVAMFSVSYGAGRAAAQGPAGAGAGGGSSSSSSGSSIGTKLNPIKWVKKDKGDQSDAKDQKEQKLTANLQAQGVLPANVDANVACENFKNREDCVAALHASKNLGLDYNCLKSNVTGVQTGADMSGCKETGGDKGISLSKAIHLLKPEADAKGEAKNAEKQAKDDIKAAGA